MLNVYKQMKTEDCNPDTDWLKKIHLIFPYIIEKLSLIHAWGQSTLNAYACRAQLSGSEQLGDGLKLVEFSEVKGGLSK